MMSKEPSVGQNGEFKILCVDGSTKKLVFETIITCEKGTYSFSYPKTFSEVPRKPQGHCLVKRDNLVYCIGGEHNDAKALKEDKEEELGKSVDCVNVSSNSNEETTKVWKKETMMNESRRYFGAALYDGKLVVNGGQNGGGQRLNTTEQFHENKWNKLDAETNVPRAYHALVAAETNGVWSLFAIGGWTKKSESSGETISIKSVEKISIKSVESPNDLNEQWELKKDMNIARGRFAAVFCAGFIYAIGGYSGKARETVEKYDISEDTWTEVESMNIGRYGHAACVVKDKIFVFGGRNKDNEIEKTVEFYDPELKKWMSCGELKHECISHAVVGL